MVACLTLPRSVWLLDLKTLAFERVKKQGAHVYGA